MPFTLPPRPYPADALEAGAETARDRGGARADVQDGGRQAGKSEPRRQVARERPRGTPVPVHEVEVREREPHFRIGQRRVVEQLADGAPVGHEEAHGRPPSASLTPIAAGVARP